MIHFRLLCPSVQWKFQEAKSFLCFMALTGMVSASSLNLFVLRFCLLVVLHYNYWKLDCNFCLISCRILGNVWGQKQFREIGKYSA